MARNRLDSETSPYLLQHRDNPVPWQPWDDEALDEAKRSNRPILLSIGYSACHWCHVMAHESFENAETAALMDELFVNIKVDREERPDLDTIYQTSLALLGQQGGWPLTMFLTAEGEPFWGGTYFPPEPRFGRPGFRDVLRTVHNAYRTEPDRIRHNREAIADALGALSGDQTAGSIPPGRSDDAAAALLRELDPVNGGLGSAPKFPQVMAQELMWRAYCRSGDTDLRDAVLLTLRRMCQGGIYDHLGGGFSRYTVDACWLVPHFEKMLYDNALLIELMTAVWQDTRDDLFEIRTRETVDWMLRDMAAPDGGFASAWDADSEGVEGKFYTWSAAEIDALLGADAALFKAAYDVTPGGNWEDVNILNRNGGPAGGTGDDAPDENRLAAQRAVLLAARAGRVPPGHDDKVLADWNGLAIAALARAGAAFGRPDWIDAAARSFAFVCDRMAEGDRLRHSYRAGQLRGGGVLDDYANMARAALLLHEVTADPAYLARAEAWVATVDRHYRDEATGGYFFTPDDGERLIVRTRSANDSATPAGNGVMVEVLARLYAVTAKPDYRDRAQSAAEAFGRETVRAPLALCTLLNAYEMLSATVQVVIVGESGDDATEALRRAVFETPAPNRVLTTVAPGASLPEGHPAAGKGMIDGHPAAYVCVGATCSLPIPDPAALSTALSTALRPASPGPAEPQLPQSCHPKQ